MKVSFLAKNTRENAQISGHTLFKNQYKQIQTWVKQNYGFVPETCWIADVKFQAGLPMRKAPNRKGAERVKPCPPEKVDSIRAALHHFGVIG